MGKFLKQGKVVIILRGRHAGKKAVVVKAYDDGSSNRKFQHLMVAGISKGPKRINRDMDKKKIAKRSTIRPFVKFVNYNHVMPTRYQVDLELKKVELPQRQEKGSDVAPEPLVVSVDDETYVDPAKRVNVRKAAKKVFEAAYFAQDKRKNAKAEEGVKYFFQKLRF